MGIVAEAWRKRRVGLGLIDGVRRIEGGDEPLQAVKCDCGQRSWLAAFRVLDFGRRVPAAQAPELQGIDCSTRDALESSDCGHGRLERKLRREAEFYLPGRRDTTRLVVDDGEPAASVAFDAVGGCCQRERAGGTVELQPALDLRMKRGEP